MERLVSTDKHAPATHAGTVPLEVRKSESTQGTKSSDFGGSVAHELQLLKAEKAVIAGELQKEKELRGKMQTVGFSWQPTMR